MMGNLAIAAAGFAGIVIDYGRDGKLNSAENIGYTIAAAMIVNLLIYAFTDETE